jgi:hypothetical protein
MFTERLVLIPARHRLLLIVVGEAQRVDVRVRSP